MLPEQSGVQQSPPQLQFVNVKRPMQYGQEEHNRQQDPREV